MMQLRYARLGGILLLVVTAALTLGCRSGDWIQVTTLPRFDPERDDLPHLLWRADLFVEFAAVAWGEDAVILLYLQRGGEARLVLLHGSDGRVLGGCPVAPPLRMGGYRCEEDHCVLLYEDGHGQITAARVVEGDCLPRFFPPEPYPWETLSLLVPGPCTAGLLLDHRRARLILEPETDTWSLGVELIQSDIARPEDYMR